MGRDQMGYLDQEESLILLIYISGLILIYSYIYYYLQVFCYSLNHNVEWEIADIKNYQNQMQDETHSFLSHLYKIIF
jgi:hypothetical protein